MDDKSGTGTSDQDKVRLVQRAEAEAARARGSVASKLADGSQGQGEAQRLAGDPLANDSLANGPKSETTTSREPKRFRSEAPPAYAAQPDPDAVVPSREGSTRALMAAAAAAGQLAVERVNTTFRSASMKRRAATAFLFAAAALGAFAGGSPWTMLLVGVVVTMCAAEFFDAVRRAGFRPATMLGIAATVAAVVGTYFKGGSALALVSFLLVAFTLLWFLTGIGKAAATINVSVTLFGFGYIAIAGTHAALLLRMPDGNGLAIFIAAVVLTIVYDTAAYIGGSTFGRHPLARHISPNKTWEGLALGTVAVLVVGALGISFIHPWTSLAGLLLGVLVAIVAPIGDLAESMIKRDLGIKDMGKLLPGHGGLLDRCDAMLLVLPASYYLALVLNVV